MFYTYLWLRENGIPYYAGKGKGNRGFTGKGHRVHCPSKDRIILQEWPSEEDAFEAEKFLILYYGRLDLGTGCLANLTEGGDGSSGTVVSNETKEKMSIFQTGRIKSEDHKRKIKESNIRTLCERGRSEEWRKKQRESHLGQIPSPEAIRKGVEKRTGKKRNPCSEETKAKISKALIGKPTGRILSEEHKRKLINGRWSKKT